MYPPLYPKMRCIKYWIFRFRHGFFPSDCWNLDHTLAEFLLPRLKYFRKSTCGYPFMIDGKEITFENWEALVDEMIDGFELKVQEWEKILTEEEAKRVARAFDLLGKHGQDLWD